MIYTNEKVIIDSEGSLEALEAAIVQLEEYLEPSFPGIQFEFLEDPFPHYIVPEGLDFSHLKNVLGDEVKRRAINETVYDITERTFEKEIKHYYSQRELEQKADELVQAIKEKDELEIRKKVLVHQMNEEIKEIEVQISNLATARREKHEIKRVECTKQLNITDNKVYYLADNDIVTVEDMTPQDRQLFINFDSMPGVSTPGSIPEEKAPGVEVDITTEMGVEIPGHT